MPDIDLERGVQEDQQRRRRRRTTEERPPSEAQIEQEIQSRLDRTFDRIVKARQARDDEELAEVIQEDKDAMAQGFLSLTNNIPFLRNPLIMFLNVLEPVLAFNRVARILFIRWMDRRARRAQEREQTQVLEYEGEPTPGTSVA